MAQKSKGYQQSKIHFLTYIDAYATVPASERTMEMKVRVHLIRQLLDFFIDKQNRVWKQGATTLPDRLFNCILITILKRLMFYGSRTRAHDFNTMQEHITTLPEKFSIPLTWDLYTEMDRLAEDMRLEAYRTEAQFKSAVELEWADPPIPISEFTDPLEDSAEVCAICTDMVACPGVLTRPCKHVYCQDCLETWVFACASNSHTCTTCRTELFPRPEYKQKHSVAGTDYRTASNELEIMYMTLRKMKQSAVFFAAELALQHDFEAKMTS